jgi:hypothetical protein
VSLLSGLAAFLAFGQQALAQDDAQSRNPYHVKVLPRAATDVSPDATSSAAPVANLYPIVTKFSRLGRDASPQNFPIDHL